MAVRRTTAMRRKRGLRPKTASAECPLSSGLARFGVRHPYPDESSVKAVQRKLGHASATTTLDCYAHLWPDGDDITRRALDAGLAQVVSPACQAAPAESLA